MLLPFATECMTRLRRRVTSMAGHSATSMSDIGDLPSHVWIRYEVQRWSCVLAEWHRSSWPVFLIPCNFINAVPRGLALVPL
jgi:hypothetical protein